MPKAAELWASIRNQGKSTASNDSLDGDVILVAQAISQLATFDEVVVITTNLKHISRFETEGISVVNWQQTLNSLQSENEPFFKISYKVLKILK